MSGAPSTVRMWLEKLVVATTTRRPLEELTPEAHIHGGLRLEIQSRLVPYMGYWGPDDVCMRDWLVELQRAARALGEDGGRHVFDEGEQGQPAFEFSRRDGRGYFSIVASEISEAEGDEAWQDVAFDPNEFIEALNALLDDFKALLLEKSPNVAPRWLARIQLNQP